MTCDKTLNVTLSNVVILPLMVTVTFAVKVWHLGWVTYGAGVFSILVTVASPVMTWYLYWVTFSAGVFPISVTVTCPVMTYGVVVCSISTWHCDIFDYNDRARCCDVDFGLGDLFCTHVLFVFGDLQ